MLDKVTYIGFSYIYLEVFNDWGLESLVIVVWYVSNGGVKTIVSGWLGTGFCGYAEVITIDWYWLMNRDRFFKYIY